MCGIAGLIATKKDISAIGLENLLAPMMRAIAHRGPDSQGTWLDVAAGVAFGHLRLAIVDLSPEGHQPMLSASKRMITAYNGEIYNFLALRNELESAGHVFRGRSDTEVLLAAIDRWGLNRTCQKINGMFAIALYDQSTKEVHFIRDRLGKKPLYVGWAGSHLVFASELKAFRAHPDFVPQLNQQTLQSYYQYGSIPAPHTIYKNVWSVLPGTRMTVLPEKLSAGENLLSYMTPYWQVAQIVQGARARGVDRALSETEIVNEFESLLRSCVQDRMISDVPLGAFLSGGIDSSTVIALMQASSGQRVKTFNIGFSETKYDESAYARKVANHLDTDHFEQIVTPQDAREVIPKLPDMYDEPCSDVSQIPTYLVSAFARKHVTVALSGDGGDEMLGGYRRHMFLQHYGSIARFLPSLSRTVVASVLRHLPPALTGNNANEIKTFANILSAPDILGAHQQFLSSWAQESPLLTWGTPQYFPMLDQAHWPTGLGAAEQSMFADLIHYLPNDILVKVDRASMAIALEARAPLLDYKICEYAWRLPLQYKIRNNQSKWLLREVLARHVPRDLFERPKQGFSVPIGAWLRGDLKEWANGYLNEASLAQTGLYNVPLISKIWAEHGAGTHDHAAKLWPILMAQNWMERYKPQL